MAGLSPAPSQPPSRHDGARRLLLQLVKDGLHEAAMPRAAALAVVLDEEPAEPRGAR